MWRLGNEEKARKMSAERAQKMLIDNTILTKWDKRLRVSCPRIKAFFQKPPAEIKRYIKEVNDNMNGGEEGLIEDGWIMVRRVYVASDEDLLIDLLEGEELNEYIRRNCTAEISIEEETNLG